MCPFKAERPCSYAARTREYYDALIAALRYRAYRCGYALAVHGSLKTDIDLIAVPWRDSAVDAAFLAEEMRTLAEQIVGTARTRPGDPNPTKKPCGRLAWSFYLVPDGMEGPYIDLSVMPVPVEPISSSSAPQQDARLFNTKNGVDVPEGEKA